jgi:hypothetical protein
MGLACSCFSSPRSSLCVLLTSASFASVRARMNNHAVRVHTDERIHAEVLPLVLLRLAHVRVALTVLALRRRRCGN